MGIEEEILRSFKYAGFSQKADPTQMIRSLIRQLEVNMLSQMKAKIQIRLGELQGEATPVDDAMDPFAILGVGMNATHEEVKTAYKKKAHEEHPDTGGDTMEMAKVNAAYEAICIFKGWKSK